MTEPTALKIEVAGCREPGTPTLALIHGWGMHCNVFTEVIETLAPRFQLLLIDLPGHGRNHQLSRIPPLAELADQIAGAVATLVDEEPITCLGWSLGGQLALTLALQHPQQINRLVLVASTPRFVRDATWPHGMPAAVFDQFAADLREDHVATWQRFLALEVHGTATAKQDLRRLRQVATDWPPPNPTALADGLELLGNNDLRDQLCQIHTPTLIVSGGRDRLVPPAAGRWMASQLARADHQVLSAGGHAPFIGDSTAFLKLLEPFALADHARLAHV
ncbi:MAG: pimeloyl-ACP methyl ester esterase BioH [Pseudomonadota bacterium]